MSVRGLLRWCLHTLRKRNVWLISVVGFRSVTRVGLGFWLGFRVAPHLDWSTDLAGMGEWEGCTLSWGDLGFTPKPGQEGAMQSCWPHHQTVFK